MLISWPKLDLGRCKRSARFPPVAALRWGKRPKRAITARCLRAKSAVRASTTWLNSGISPNCRHGLAQVPLCQQR
jgi:hypothetical protein